MKNKIINKYSVIISLILLGIIISACGKYEHGPAFSLISKTKRLSGSWDLYSIDNNGTTVSIPSNVSIKTLFNDNGTGRYTINITIPGYGISLPITADMDWEFTENKEKLSISVDEENVNWGLLNPDLIPDDFDFGEDFDVDQEDFDPNDLILMLNINAKILKLTSKDLWLEETRTENSQTIIATTKMSKE